MRVSVILTTVLVFVSAQHPSIVAQKVPAAPRGTASQTFFGTAVPDPYRWLEAYDTPKVRAWYAAEDSIALASLNANPFYARFIARRVEMRTSRPYSLSFVEETPVGMFYLKRMPGEQSPSLYVRDLINGERLLMSPAQAGDGAVIIAYQLSPTSTYVEAAYTLGGNERVRTTLIELATGRIIANEIPELGEVVDWQIDGRSFFYTTSRDLGPSASWGQRHGGLPVLQHVLGTDHKTDRTVFDLFKLTGDSIAHLGGMAVREHFVVGVVYREGFYKEPETFAAPAESLEQGGAMPWVRIASPKDSITDVRVEGPWFYARTYRGNPRGKVLRVPIVLSTAGVITAPQWSAAQVVLEDSTLDFQFAQYPPAFSRDGVYWLNSEGGESHLMRFSFSSLKKEEVPAPPFEGSFAHLRGERDRPGLSFVYGGWTKADRNYRYDPATGRTEERPALVNPVDPFDHLDGLTAETVFISSHDGVKLPMTILRLKGDGKPAPTILYGYGAYGSIEDASFRQNLLPWLERGGVYAICHARGGGYYGAEWQAAGTKEKKPNTWKDGIACAEHLIRVGITTPALLGINGTSAGGIFAGRAITERPELFAAAVIEVGVADMVRMNLTSAGPGNVVEFGSPDTEPGFRALLEMSTYHHIKPGVRYPATLLYAGFNDSRVAPWHPAKVAAALRYAGGAAALPNGSRPVLLRVGFDAGHGLVGATATAEDERAAMSLAFFAARLGLR